MPGDNPYIHHHEREGRGGDFETWWQKNESDLKVRCACGPCNSGWMDRLDHAAEETFLNAAVAGTPTTLTKFSDQQLLARWCALIGVLFSQAQANPVLGHQQARVVKNGGIPARTRVWALSTTPPAFVAWGSAKTWGMGDPAHDQPDAYFVTFGVNHFIAQVFIPTDRTPEEIAFDRSRNAHILNQLWPSSLTTFAWPPSQSVSWEDTPDLAKAFEQ